MPARSAHFRLVEIRMGRNLGSYLSERAQAGDKLRDIADDLTRLTGVSVSHETVRQWVRLVTQDGAA